MEPNPAPAPQTTTPPSSSLSSTLLVGITTGSTTKSTPSAEITTGVNVSDSDSEYCAKERPCRFQDAFVYQKLPDPSLPIRSRRRKHHLDHHGPGRIIVSSFPRLRLCPYSRSERVPKFDPAAAADDCMEGARPRACRVRFKWTLEWHKRFLEAVEKLGGLDKATVEAVHAIMTKDNSDNGNDNRGPAPDFLDVWIHLSGFCRLLDGTLQSHSAAARSGSTSGSSAALSNMVDILGGLKLK